MSEFNNLNKCNANFQSLSPLSFIRRAKDVYPNNTAYAYGNIKRNWEEVYQRACQLASALKKNGVGENDTVAVIAPNIPEIFEAHFGVPMIGAVINPINIRLDSATIQFILEHGDAKVLITDSRFAPTVKVALEKLKQKILVIDIVDKETRRRRR